MSTLVIGVGNRDRGDDAIGLILVDALAGRGLPGLVTVAHEGDMSHLPLLWTAEDDVVIVDAVIVEAGHHEALKLGEVRLFDASDLRRPCALSTHGLGVAEALALADHLGRTPRSVRIVGVGVDEVGFGAAGTTISRQIPAIVERLVDLVAGDAQALGVTSALSPVAMRP